MEMEQLIIQVYIYKYFLEFLAATMEKSLYMKEEKLY